MSMQLRKKEVPVGENGRTLLVAEAGWDYTFRFKEIDDGLLPKLEDPNHNSIFKFFLSNYYALLAACVESDVPAPEEAFTFPRKSLDDWYWAVWELNEDIIGSPCPTETASEEVVFRDNSKLTVYESHGLPSFVLRLIELEEQAVQHPMQDDPQGQLFQSMFYPKMAASCNGSNVPDAITVRHWPQSEISKWMEASRRVNPDWYLVVEPEVKATERKKKARRPSGG